MGGEEFGDPLAARADLPHPHWKCLDPALHQPGFLWGGAVPSMPTCRLIVTPTSPSAAMTAPPVMSERPLRYLVVGWGQDPLPATSNASSSSPCSSSPGSPPCSSGATAHRGQMERPPATRRAGRRGPSPSRRPQPVVTISMGSHGVALSRERHAPSFGRVRGRWHLSMPLRLRSRPGRSGRARRMPWSAVAAPNSICPVCEGRPISRDRGGEPHPPLRRGRE